MDDQEMYAATGPKSNGLGGDYPAARASRPLLHSAPTDYGLKRSIDPRGFYDLDNVHTPGAPRAEACCDFTPLGID